MLADLKLSHKRKKGRHKGASRYLCYPEHTIYSLLGGRILEADFIGKKFIAGRTEPVNFIGFSFKKAPKLRYFLRVEAQTAECFIESSKLFFEKFERPDFVKVDNCLAAIGSASAKRSISRTITFLLKRQIIPIFSVPRKPFSQASIEGNNSVFARKFWNAHWFSNVQEIDEKLERFNLSSHKYTKYQLPTDKRNRKENFIPRIYFIRQVQGTDSTKTRGYIDILNERIVFPASYIHYYILAEWNLGEELLYIYFEKEQESKLIKKLPFQINPKSKLKC